MMHSFRLSQLMYRLYSFSMWLFNCHFWLTDMHIGSSFLVEPRWILYLQWAIINILISSSYILNGYTQFIYIVTTVSQYNVLQLSDFGKLVGQIHRGLLFYVCLKSSLVITAQTDVTAPTHNLRTINTITDTYLLNWPIII